MVKSRECFREGGILSQRVPGFVHRPCQEDMAGLVEDALASSTHAVVEAETGTGKSYAYIVPLILRAKMGMGREIIATSTLPLMNQLLRKDIPQMMDALDASLAVSALYGRSNYLCVLKWDYLFQAEKTDPDVRKFSDWVDETDTGLREDLKDASLYQVFQEASADRESCIGRFCPYISQCFYYKARKEAENADIIVTNHHVVLADIMLRREKNADADEAVLLPKFDAMVIDEAHNFPDGATDAFTSSFSSKTVSHALKMLTGRRAGKGMPLLEALSPCLKDRAANGQILAMLDETAEMASAFNARAEAIIGSGSHGSDRFYFSEGFYEESRFALREFSPFADRLSELASLLVSSYAAEEDAGEDVWGDLKTLSFAADTLAEQGYLLANWIEFTHPAEEIPYASWENDGLSIAFAPMDTGTILSQSFLDNGSPVVFSSATLSVGGSFDFFASQTGLDRCDTGYVSGRFPTSFDMKSNLLVLVPEDSRSYSNTEKASWENSLALPIAKAIKASGGGALVLFTSRSSMENVYPLVKHLIPDMKIFMQESRKSRNLLLRSFKEDEDSSLFALSSFWEGIDAPGRTLRLLIIPKLPYPVPTDPIIAARGEMLAKNSGKSAFMEQSVPICALKMKQGIGRVIRGEHDRGAVLILDRRILKPMSRRILSSLPECQLITDLPLDGMPEKVSGFFRNGSS